MNGDLDAFVGHWELPVDLPGAADVRGLVVFDRWVTSVLTMAGTGIETSG